MRSASIAGAAIAVTAVLAPWTASAAQPHAFAGNCHFEGSGGGDEIGYVPREGDWHVEGRGVCSGVVDGVRILAEPASLEYRIEDDPLDGCAPYSLGSGEGTLRVRKARFPFTIQHAGPGFHLRTRPGGDAVGVSTAFTSWQPEPLDRVAQRCADRTLNSYNVRSVLQTVTPLLG